MKKYMFWIFEALCWLILLSIIAGGVVFFKYETNKKHTLYQIFLPDVDGLIIGSPVKFMGIQIGYVKDISIIEDRVLLKFLVTEENMKLPMHTIATVEFYGLGGSKSLELYPPKNENTKTMNIIIAQPPKKIGDSLGLIYDMYEDVSDIIFMTSNFMTKTGFIKKDVDFVKINSDNIINRANIMFNKDYKKLEDKENLWKEQQSN